jgi:hypothetical protein
LGFTLLCITNNDQWIFFKKYIVKIKFHFNENIELHCMQFELIWNLVFKKKIQFNYIEINWKEMKCMHIGRKGIEKYFMKMVLEKQNLKRHTFKKTPCHVFMVDKGFCRFYIEIVQMTTYNLWNLNFSYINQLWRIITWIFKKGINVKACYEFGNEPMKMCFEHK